MRWAWHREQMCAVDTETTGTDVERDRVVTAAVVPIIPGRTPEPVRWVIDPGVPVPDEAAAVHGYTTERVRAEGVEPARALEEIADEIVWQFVCGVPVVVMNAPFDLTILDRDCRRHGVAPLSERVPVTPVIDPRVLDKEVDYRPWRFRTGSRRLTDLCAHYRVDIGAAHDCADDALAAARVAWRIAQQNPRFAHMALAELHKRQVTWHAAQAASLERYFRASDKARERGTHDPDAVVRREWPLIPYPQNMDNDAPAGYVVPSEGTKVMAP